MPTFDIINDRWLDVLGTDGKTKTLSLRELLRTAHDIARLSEPSPLTEVALLRFLIALVSDGLREQILTEEDWAPFAERCRSGLPSELVDAILAPLQVRSNVLDPDHDAFFDGPAVRQVSGWHDANVRQPASRFLPELPTGTNLSHFTKASDEASALCVGCMLKSRFVDAAFARGGLGPSLSRYLLATVSGTEPRYVVPMGGTLLKTLLLNAVIEDESRPSWVSIHKHENGNPGPVARMAWRPRLLMPVVSSETDRSCIRCATIHHPRFANVVMLDTYNHKGSPFGAQGDVEQWKSAGGDPHLLPFKKNSITLGVSSDEWPLRAAARSLIGDTGTILDRLPERAALLGPIAVSVTSSGGNQAKIDDAPHATIILPSALLALSAADRSRIATALAGIFDKANRESRGRLIPDTVPSLLRDLTESEDPDKTVGAWLDSAKTLVRLDSDGIVNHETTDGGSQIAASDSLREAAKRLVNRLSRLSPRQLAALRPVGQGGATDVAARQDAFDVVWHSLWLPPGSRRHAMREALATVAPIYAMHAEHHRISATRRSFEEQLRRGLNSERSSSASSGEGSLERLISRILHATPATRDNLLMQLLDEMVRSGSNRHPRSIDFTDLLLDIAYWNDPADPTPVRWRQFLNSTFHSRSTAEV